MGLRGEQLLQDLLQMVTAMTPRWQSIPNADRDGAAALRNIAPALIAVTQAILEQPGCVVCGWPADMPNGHEEDCPVPVLLCKLAEVLGD